MPDHRDGPRLINALFAVFEELPPRQQAIFIALMGGGGDAPGVPRSDGRCRSRGGSGGGEGALPFEAAIIGVMLRSPERRPVNHDRRPTGRARRETQWDSR
jgi:hypothetical protein